MRKFLMAFFWLVVMPIFAAAPPHGADRLRDLVVFPKMSVNFKFGMTELGDEFVVSQPEDPSREISQLRDELKQRPDDTGKLLKLGIFLNGQGETNEANTCFDKVKKLCLDKIAANPQDGPAMDDLGESLGELGKNEEAIGFYRKAAVVSPKDWRCQVRLGNVLASENFILMFPEDLRSKLTPGAEPPPEILESPPPAGAVKEAEASLQEASRCFDRAKALAPEEPDIFFQKAGYLSMSNWENCVFEAWRGGTTVLNEWVGSFFSEDTVANLQKAGELSQNNCDAISLAAYFELMHTQAGSTNWSAANLADKSQRLIQGDLTRLENLSQGLNKKMAVAALENLGMLNFALGNTRAATTYLRQAVALDPTRDDLWDLLLISCSSDATFPDQAVDICQAHLKYEDSVENHLKLSKAYVYKEKWSEAAAQAVIAASGDTNNLLAPLQLAALDLKQSGGNVNFLLQAKALLDRAYELLMRQPRNTESLNRWREINLDGAIFFGLLGTPDDVNAAKQNVQGVLKYFPDDPTAREIEQALE